jgi:CDP-diacylglycerol---glycerol-3-phosphate 3-phosphatidyltransferase
MNSGAIATLIVFSLILLTMAGVAVVRPSVPARLDGYRGPIRWLGYWAFWVSGPVLRVFRVLRLTADQVTFLGVFLTALAGIAAAFGAWGWGFLLLVFGSWCDLLDGEVARTTGTQTSAGAFLDSNLDRVSEIVLFAGLAVAFPTRGGMLWAGAALVASLMVSYTRARGEGLGVACPNFGLERPHRVVLAMVAFLGATFLPERLAVLLLLGLCALVALGAGFTALARMAVIHQLLRRGVTGVPGAAAPESPPSA